MGTDRFDSPFPLWDIERVEYRRRRDEEYGGSAIHEK
jgi:hypothetical protein